MRNYYEKLARKVLDWINWAILIGMVPLGLYFLITGKPYTVDWTSLVALGFLGLLSNHGVRWFRWLLGSTWVLVSILGAGVCLTSNFSYGLVLFALGFTQASLLMAPIWSGLRISIALEWLNRESKRV